jgi:hypothetical protein
LHWRLNFEGSIRTVTSERVLLDARCRVTNAWNLQQGDDEEPSAGDTAGVPVTQKSLQRGDDEESNVGDTTSAQLAANG